ncbi:MAG: hypothetical protein AAF909_07810 [Pseudomonadota bacterium]
MSALKILFGDIVAQGVALTEDDWRTLCASFDAVTHPAGDVILCQSQIAESWLFVAEGVAASTQTTTEGDAWIARFFEAGHLAANLTSVWRREHFVDDLVAITQVTGVIIPDAIFRDAYLRGGAFGEYLRRKAMDTLLFDKELISAKTSASLERRHAFLKTFHRDVLSTVPKKDVARFLGVTPQSYSRFLRRSAGDKT